MATSTGYELFMFMSSHFNEKARWALDYKGVPHRRTPLLPGPHAGTIQKLTGQSATPVLVIDGEAVHDSPRILDALERRHPDPPLYPADAAERERALEIQRHFDAEVGPKVRRALFSIMIEDPRYLARMFAGHKNAVVRGLYGGVFPLVKKKMKSEMKVEEPHVGEAFEATRQAFDWVGKHVGPSGYLVGDGFTVADLTVAALLAPGVEIDHPDMTKPKPYPSEIQAWLARWADLPGAAWVRKIYAKHRPGRAPEA